MTLAPAAHCLRGFRIELLWVVTTSLTDISSAEASPFTAGRKPILYVRPRRSSGSDLDVATWVRIDSVSDAFA